MPMVPYERTKVRMLLDWAIARLVRVTLSTIELVMQSTCTAARTPALSCILVLYRSFLAKQS